MIAIIQGNLIDFSFTEEKKTWKHRIKISFQFVEDSFPFSDPTTTTHSDKNQFKMD